MYNNCMSKQLLSVYRTQDNSRYSELFYDDDWGNYCVYFYENNGFSGVKKISGNSLVTAEETARCWTSENATAPVVCHKFDYLVATIKARAIEMRKVLKY